MNDHVYLDKLNRILQGIELPDPNFCSRRYFNVALAYALEVTSGDRPGSGPVGEPVPTAQVTFENVFDPATSSRAWKCITPLLIR